MKKRGETATVAPEKEINPKEELKPEKKEKKAKKKPQKKSEKKTKKSAKKVKEVDKTAEKEKKRAEKANKRLDPSFKNVVPYADYDEKLNVIVNRDNTAFDYIKIKTKDLMNAGTDELERDRIALTRAYRMMKGSIKIISLNFPCSTIKQDRYIQDRIDKAKDSRFIPWLKAKQYELKFLQNNTSEREYYIMVNGDNAEECAKTRNILLNALIDQAEACEKEQKIKLIEKINNPNTFVSV